jgi:hypothetical protein
LNKEFDDFSAVAKFSILRPLKSKRAAEVAYQLTDIFLLLGAPHILNNALYGD